RTAGLLHLLDRLAKELHVIRRIRRRLQGADERDTGYVPIEPIGGARRIGNSAVRIRYQETVAVCLSREPRVQRLSLPIASAAVQIEHQRQTGASGRRGRHVHAHFPIRAAGMHCDRLPAGAVEGTALGSARQRRREEQSTGQAYSEGTEEAGNSW